MTEPYHTPEYNFYPGETWNEPDFVPDDDYDDETDSRRNYYDGMCDEDDPVETDDPFDMRGWS